MKIKKQLLKVPLENCVVSYDATLFETTAMITMCVEKGEFRDLDKLSLLQESIKIVNNIHDSGKDKLTLPFSDEELGCTILCSVPIDKDYNYAFPLGFKYVDNDYLDVEFIVFK